MNTRGLWFVGTSLLTLGGCILGYPLDQYEPTSETGGSGNSVTSTSSGGLGGAGSSSSGGGSGGAMVCPYTPICDERPTTGCDADCPVHVVSTRPSALNDQTLTGVAVDSKGNIAISGYFKDGAFSLAPANASTSVPKKIPVMASYVEGFVGYYDLNGIALWAKDIEIPQLAGGTFRSINDLAFDSQDNLVVIYSEVISPGMSQSFIQKIEPGTSNTPKYAWANPIPIFNVSGLNSFPIAVSVDKTTKDANQQPLNDIYVLGIAHGMTGNVSCGVGTFTLHPGMFVAKFNTSGVCQWIRSFDNAIGSIDGEPLYPTAIYADNAALQGVWIAGKTNKSTPFDMLLSSDLIGGSYYGFVIGLKEQDGVPMAAIKLEGDISPQAILVTTNAAQEEIVTLAGALDGASSLSTDKSKGAFVTLMTIDRDTATTKIVGGQPVEICPSSFTHKTTLLTSSSTNTKVTKLMARGERVHAVGTATIDLVVPPASTKLDVGNLAPFIVTLINDSVSNTGLTIGGVQVFTATAAADPTKNPNPDRIFLAGGSNFLAIAGWWRTELNMSTRHDPGAGQLKEGPDQYPGKDIFLSKYSITP